jgi:predicted acylesterase/phospholipase RssA
VKKIVLPLILVFSISACFLIGIPVKKVTDSEGDFINPRNGVAVLMTGAGGRIPQEAALLEELDKRGLLKNLVFISGVSSGALNSVALNGILSGKMTWEEYKNILFKLKNSDVFYQERKKIPVNASPGRKLMERVVEDTLGFQTIGDLPYFTEISFTHPGSLTRGKTVFRMCSRKINEESDTTLSLVDIMMASSAVPIIFPPSRIRNVKTIPDDGYVDGGLGEDYIPYHALLEFEKFRGAGVEKVYIVSRKCDNIPASEELKLLGINDQRILEKLGISLDVMLNKRFLKVLRTYAAETPELIPITYIWKPDFKTDFPLMKFENLEEQYNLTSQWAVTHDPVPLGDFLLPYLVKKK